MKYIVGLTGGIASGKSTIAHLFSKHDIVIIDADTIAREVVMPGQTAHNTILAHFGRGILDNTHKIDRRKLRQIVFNDLEKRLWLENLLHPLIREKMMIYTREKPSLYYIHVIPLLIETLPHPELNRILVVDVSVKTQIKRLKEREHISDAMIKSMLDSQMTREARLAHADDIIENEDDITTLTVAVDALHAKYLQLCSSS